MYNPDADLLTLEKLEEAKKVLQSSGLIYHTPVLQHVQTLCGLDPSIDLYLKLESMQNTGSFKIRGVVNQMAHIPDSAARGETQLISMSAGNFGKAFAYMVKQRGLKATVFMPDTAPVNRAELIKSYGVGVERMPNADLVPAMDKCVRDTNSLIVNQDHISLMAGNGSYGLDVGRMPTSDLQSAVDRCVRESHMHFLHPFDDIHLMAGHGSVGLELLEDVPDPDVVVVCCGGGGLLGGTAAAIRLAGRGNTRVYGVEPEGAPSMYKSRKAGKPVGGPVKTIAAGLAPPYAGSNACKHNVAFVEDVVLVSDDEIVGAVKRLFSCGLVVEPSGAAAFAGLMSGKIPDVKGKKVVVMITGGNVTTEELTKLCG